MIYTDMFINPAWDPVRLAVQEKGMGFRTRGSSGFWWRGGPSCRMTGIVDTLESLDRRFELRED